MIKKVYQYQLVNEKMIEKIVDDENLILNHMVLTKGTGLPVHHANSNVYMIIIRGQMTIQLDDSDAIIHEKGEILNIPFNAKMNVTNNSDDVLEFFVVKAPNPRDMIK